MNTDKLLVETYKGLFEFVIQSQQASEGMQDYGVPLLYVHAYLQAFFELVQKCYRHADKMLYLSCNQFHIGTLEYNAWYLRVRNKESDNLKSKAGNKLISSDSYQ